MNEVHRGQGTVLGGPTPLFCNFFQLNFLVHAKKFKPSPRKNSGYAPDRGVSRGGDLDVNTSPSTEFFLNFLGPSEKNFQNTPLKNYWLKKGLWL